MPGGTDWATLTPAIVAATGFGTVAGSAIATYGGRGNERRKIRSRALKYLEHLEVIRGEMVLKEPDPQQDKPFTSLPEFRQLRVSCMIAGVPRSAIDAYGKIGDDAPWLGTADDSDPQASHLLSLMLVDASSQLIRDALYQPKLTRVIYRRRLKKLRGMAWKLYGPGPDMKEWTSLPVLYRRWCQIREADEERWKEKYSKELTELEYKTAESLTVSASANPEVGQSAGDSAATPQTS